MTQSARRGLTLVELVLTILLVGLLGVPIGILLAEHLRGGLKTRDSSVAMSLARRELELLDSFNNFCHPALDITSSSGVTFDPYLPGYAYALTRIVSCHVGDCTSSAPFICPPPSNANNGIKRIELRVTRSGSSDVLATLVSYRAKHVLFGP